MADPNFTKMSPEYKKRYREMIEKDRKEKEKKKQEKMQKEANKKAQDKASRQQQIADKLYGGSK